MAVQTDVERFVEITQRLWTKLGHDVDELDINLIRHFGSCAAGQICPVQAVIGGIAAQEVLKVLSHCAYSCTAVVKYISVSIFVLRCSCARNYAASLTFMFML